MGSEGGRSNHSLVVDHGKVSCRERAVVVVVSWVLRRLSSRHRVKTPGCNEESSPAGRRNRFASAGELRGLGSGRTCS